MQQGGRDSISTETAAMQTPKALSNSSPSTGYGSQRLQQYFPVVPPTANPKLFLWAIFIGCQTKLQGSSQWVCLGAYNSLLNGKKNSCFS